MIVSGGRSLLINLKMNINRIMKMRTNTINVIEFVVRKCQRQVALILTISSTLCRIITYSFFHIKFPHPQCLIFNNGNDNDIHHQKLLSHIYF